MPCDRATKLGPIRLLYLPKSRNPINARALPEVVGIFVCISRRRFPGFSTTQFNKVGTDSAHFPPSTCNLSEA